MHLKSSMDPAKIATEPTTSRTSGDILIETARKRGISTEGKTKKQLSQEIVTKVKAAGSA